MSLKVEVTALNHRAKRLSHQLVLLFCSLLVGLATLVLWSAPANAQRGDEEEEIFEPDDEEEEVFGPDGEDSDEGDTEDGDGGIGSKLSRSKKDPPKGFSSFEVIDRTIGFRDDSFAGISVDNQGVLWVTTYEGRIYRSDDQADNWTEFTVLPELKELWGFAGQRVLLGHLRNSDARHPKAIGLAPSGGISTNIGKCSGSNPRGRLVGLRSGWDALIYAKRRAFKSSAIGIEVRNGRVEHCAGSGALGPGSKARGIAWHPKSAGCKHLDATSTRYNSESMDNRSRSDSAPNRPKSRLCGNRLWPLQKW